MNKKLKLSDELDVGTKPATYDLVRTTNTLHFIMLHHINHSI